MQCPHAEQQQHLHKLDDVRLGQVEIWVGALVWHREARRELSPKAIEQKVGMLGREQAPQLAAGDLVRPRE